MPGDVYRFSFNEAQPFDEVLDTLDLAVMAVQSLHGLERVRLDARFVSDPNRRTLVIDAATAVGQGLCQIFLGYARREFGERAFEVQRIEREREAEQMEPAAAA